MLEDDVLAPGWEWLGAGKVKKGRKHYIRVEKKGFKYVCGAVGRGDFTINCEGGYPYLKLAALTHHDDELQRLVKEHRAQQRRNLNSI